MVFPTLAFQLAYKFPAFRTHIVKILTHQPDIAQESLHNQLTKLLIEPLKMTGISTIIVIDALDECKEEKDNQPASAILSLLARHIASIPRIKFFVTGRPEPPIRNGFRLRSLQPLTSIFVLHSVEQTAVNDDISRFFKIRLPEMVRERSDFDVSVSWPSEEDVRVLTEKSAGLFIFAATAISYISSSVDQPRDRLAVLVETPETNIGIDQLYLTVLQDGYGKKEDAEYRNTLREVMASIVFAFNPLSRNAIAEILELKPSTVASMLRRLHAVLHIPEDSDESIRVYHKSFVDFITDQTRCTDKAFHLSRSERHGMLTTACLRVMHDGLCKNICSLPRYSMNSGMELSERRKRIGWPLEYACRFWVHHFLLASASAQDRIASRTFFCEFLMEKQMEWFEVLSLVEDVGAAIHSLYRLQTYLESQRPTKRELKTHFEVLIAWVTEGLNLILGFRPCIQQSAWHLYHSALPFAHGHGHFQQTYVEDLKIEAQVVDRYKDWPITISNGQRRVTRVKYSKNGESFATIDGSVKVFSTITGELRHVFRAEVDIHSADFSPDDTSLVSGGYCCPVDIWDMQTGGLVRSLDMPPDPIYHLPRLADRFDAHVQYSPSGDWIAMGSCTCICIWNASTGVLRNFYNSRVVRMVGMAWLSEGTSLQFVVHTFPAGLSTWEVDGSKSNVELWNVSTETRTVIHGDPVNSFAVSLQHSLIACATPEKLKIYDSSSFEWKKTFWSDIAPLGSGRWESPVTFSPSTEAITLFWDNQVFRASDIDSGLKVDSTSFKTNKNIYVTVDFSPISSHLAVTMDTITRLWSFHSRPLDSYGNLTWFRNSHRGSELYVAPDGEFSMLISPRDLVRASVDDDNKKFHWLTHLALGDILNESIIPISNIAFSPGSTSYLLYCACDPILPDLDHVYHESTSGYSTAVLSLSISDAQSMEGLAHRLRSRLPGLHRTLCYLNESTAVMLSAQACGVPDPGNSTQAVKNTDKPEAMRTKVELIDAKSGEILRCESPPGWTDFGRWLKDPYHTDFLQEYQWIEADKTGSVLRIHNQSGAEGQWRLHHPKLSAIDPTSAAPASPLGEESQTRQAPSIQPAFSKVEPEIDEDLYAHLTNLNQYPVITSGKDWIYNHKGQRILWIPPRVETTTGLHRSWRWNRDTRRLVVAGDSAVGTWFMVDFSEVDVEIPDALDTYLELGFKTVTLSGIERQVSAQEKLDEKEREAEGSGSRFRIGENDGHMGYAVFYTPPPEHHPGLIYTE
ncbi:Vegetative incompatibility protein HET-E-1 [Hypsizygus marmoreus]|uniref:Vegetative incompatibility protein HET-E-1 n=1 Tax=Hypsizygus marmoreus TaxID=39966 RepID=A0A369JIB9_HYPMA|nr:Vegetative incompatibility protein HET-E-1 [Hypsizygus marmoreus]